MASRIFWGLILAVPFLFLVLQSLPLILVCFAIVHFIAHLEFTGLTSEFSISHRVFHGLLATLIWLLLALGLAHQLPAQLALVVLALAAIAYLAGAAICFDLDRDYRSWLQMLSALLLITLPLAFIPAVAGWPVRFPCLLLLLGASWGADTGAIFAGKMCGRTLICPRLSPKKTLEGLCGGAVSAGLIYLGAGLLYSSTASGLLLTLQPRYVGLGLLFLLGVALSLLGFFGDLVFSLYKRTARRKDYGAVIPGHGGVLDRFDSMLFVAPGLFVLCWSLI